MSLIECSVQAEGALGACKVGGEATPAAEAALLDLAGRFRAPETSVDGMPTDWHLVHLGSRAAGGAGLVFVEATAVSPEGRITPGDVGIWTDEHARPLARIADFVSRMGAVPAIQIGHSGRKARLTRPWQGQQPLTADHPEMFDWEG